MKTWPEWHQLWSALQAEREVRSPLFTKSTEWEIVVAKIEAAERSSRAKVDAACRRWIEQDEWPRMSERVAWFVWLRCVHALSASLLLLHPCGSGAEAEPAFVPAPGITEEKLMRWFLIDSWSCGWPELRERLRDGGPSPKPRPAPGRN